MAKPQTWKIKYWCSKILLLNTRLNKNAAVYMENIKEECCFLYGKVSIDNIDIDE